MGLKYNGVDAGDGGVRFYDTSKGIIIHKVLADFEMNHGNTELEFSRKVLQTKPRQMTLHADHRASPETKGAFYINGICSDKDLRITFATGMRDKIVISKNLVDFLFCATNQSFKSCFGLHNGDAGLRRMHACDGVYITYITNADDTYRYQDTDYVHPKMQGRAFLYESEDNRHYLVGRPYGKVGYELRDALRRFLPSGTEEGWKLSDEQMDLEYHRWQYDNFSRGRAVHDIYDRTFFKKALYEDSDITIRYK